MSDISVKGVYNSNMVIDTNDSLLTVKLYDESNTSFERGVAYLKNDYFYIFRGKLYKNLTKTEPGIYLDDNDKPILFEVETDEDKVKYRIEDKIVNLDVSSLNEELKSCKTIMISLPESNKTFIPNITNTDDILKRIVKKALMQKNIDIDQYKTRFTNKNALFNLKQVIKGDAKLSMLLFERLADALNLKYKIIIEERDSDVVIGNILEDPIEASSEDTYDL